MNNNQLSKIMNTSDGLLMLSNILKDSRFEISANLISDNNDLLKYELELYSNNNVYISLKFNLTINQTLLLEKIIKNGGVVIPHTEINDIKEFIIRRNIELLQYLKEYNNELTDYDKLAEMYYKNRGVIIGKRFGF